MRILYVSSNGGIHDYRFLKKLVGDYEVLFLHYAANDIIDEIRSLKGLKIVSKKPKPIKTYPLLSEKNHFKKLFDEFKPDIIHSGYVWQVGALVSSFNIHPHLSMPWGSDILTEPDKRFLFRRLVKKVMIQCDHIQCDAEVVKKKIMNDYGINNQKISVFPWGIDLSQFKPIDKHSCRNDLSLIFEKFIIIYNRFFESIYGINYLLEGFKEFSKNKKDVLLLLLSSGSLESETKKYIRDNNLESKALFVGKVHNSEIPKYLNAADVYISTSLSDGTSLSLLEAMACGLGLVVTGVPAIKEWVGQENGLVIPLKSSVDVTNALETYYNDRNLIKTHGEKSITIASERADWDKNYMILKGIYNKILNM